MPFSKTKEHHTEEYWKRQFNSYLKPLIQRNPQLEAIRSEPLRGDIASQIITDLANDEIVVADLTDHNPNVFWELGVRQSFKHRTVTIADDIPHECGDAVECVSLRCQHTSVVFLCYPEQLTGRDRAVYVAV